MYLHTNAVNSLDLQAAIDRTPLIVSPDTTVMVAIVQMSGVCALGNHPRTASSPADSHCCLEARASCVVVVENEQVVGILTERDVVRLIAQQLPFDSLLIKQVMTSPIVTLKESAFTDICFAINLLQEHHIQHLPILDDQNRLVGLVTDESLRKLSRPINLLQLRLVNEVMTREIICALPQVSALAIAQKMAEHGVSSIVIVETTDNQKAEGRRQKADCHGLSRRTCPEPSRSRSVSEGESYSKRRLILSRTVSQSDMKCTGSPKVNETAEFPAQDISLLVSESQILTPIGIITKRDLVQFQALGLNLASHRAEAMMSTPLFTVEPEESLWNALQIMQQRFVRRLVVRGKQSDLLGVVTQTNIQQALNPLEMYRLAEVLEAKVVRLEAEKVELLKSRTAELERQVAARTAALEAKAEREKLLADLATQIHSSLSLQTILETTVEQVRQVLECDRVNIWRFESNWQCIVVAESTDLRPSLVGERITETFFSQDLAKVYRQGWIRVVSDIYSTEMSPCHREMLVRLQTRAKILVPLLCRGELWGLLNATECDHARDWQPEDVELLQALSMQLALALQQATTYQRLRAELSERRQAETRLRESEQRYASLAAAVPVGILRSDASGKCIYVNDRWCQIAGLTPEVAIGHGWRQALHPEDRDLVIAAWEQSAQDHQPFRFEYRYQRPDNEMTWVYGQSVPEWDANGQVVGYVDTITDINGLKQAQELIIHNALHDPLTNLPNRTLLIERLELAIWQAERSESYHYAVLFLDLDRFKVVNDSLGHLVGDQLLKTIAQKLETNLRKLDLVARLGGDEFVILLENIKDTKEVIYITERILADCQTPLIINGHEIFTSMSIGIVVGTKEYHQAADLIRDADIAMYQAKSKGKKSYKFFDAAMHAQALNRLTLETDLQKALEQGEFILYYQPIVDLLKNRLVGFEALARWPHSTRGFISPEEFIPIAEETGSIVQLDSWVLCKACRQIATWKARFGPSFPLEISINLCAQDLRKANLVKHIDYILADAGLAGESISLEITERMLIEDIDQTIDLLAQLASRNIQISIDDFGTGYSSLNYLHRLPAHSLKIDRSFVSQMQAGNRNYQVVSTIIALSNQLGLTVVAEGIETAQQLQQLKQLGCQFGQGYFFSEPLAAHEVEDYITEGVWKQLCHSVA